MMHPLYFFSDDDLSPILFSGMPSGYFFLAFLLGTASQENYDSRQHYYRAEEYDQADGRGPPSAGEEPEYVVRQPAQEKEGSPSDH